MGTRNLTVVVHNQEVKIAQYGQWDGFPDAQGISILAFLSVASRVENFKKTLPKIRFQTEEDVKKQEEYMKSIGCEDGWMTPKQSEKFKKKFPLHHRDTGGEILEAVLHYGQQEEIVLINAYEFAGDSLFCEWAYIIDFDKNTFEVYRGFNQTQLTPEDRFYSLSQEDKDYQPVKMIQSFSLDNLPSDDEFIFLCKQKI